jgi:hypothetical protein
VLTKAWYKYSCFWRAVVNGWSKASVLNIEEWKNTFDSGFHLSLVNLRVNIFYSARTLLTTTCLNKTSYQGECWQRSFSLQKSRVIYTLQKCILKCIPVPVLMLFCHLNWNQLTKGIVHTRLKYRRIYDLFPIVCGNRLAPKRLPPTRCAVSAVYQLWPSRSASGNRFVRIASNKWRPSCSECSFRPTLRASWRPASPVRALNSALQLNSPVPSLHRSRRATVRG